ncbi:OmpH family outer membrane protein [Ectothiorhodospiraceae bacterium 2226]|nr:OmpH family outer membrane protein [Ectothiorhodospiraceae bacterium 2226]
MIHRTIAIGVLVGVLLSAMPTAWADALKIGVVNTARVLEEAPQAEAASKKLEAEFAPRERELVNAQRQLKNLEDRLARDGAVMSEAERRNLERDIMGLRRDVNRGQEEYREDLNMRRNEELGRLHRRVYEVIVALAKDGNFDVLLGDTVLYASEQVDLTDQVIQRLRDEFRNGGGGTTAPRRQ